MICFIDDEPKNISAFTQAFELSDYPIEIIKKIDDAFAIVEERTPEIDAIILDVMMPPGIGMDLEETEGGLRTGLKFLNWLKKYYESIPVVLLTNLNRNECHFEHRNCQVIEKKSADPWELVNLIAEKKRRTKL